MDYISMLRQHIGHSPIMATSVTCIILDYEKGILFEKRSDNGMWCIPGGSIELGENLEDALKREVKEETALEIYHPELLSVQSNVHVVYPNGDEVYYTDVIYLVQEYSGKLEHDEESTELKWFSIDQLPENIVPLQKEFLNQYFLKNQRVKVKNNKEMYL